MELKTFEKGIEKYKEIHTWRGDNYRGYRFTLGNAKKYEISVTDSDGVKFSRVQHSGEGICDYCGEDDKYKYCTKLGAGTILEELKQHPQIRLRVLFK